MKRILVVDDSDLVSHLLEECLSDAGYDVKVARDANDGYAQALDYHPDLIILDVQLPDVTGFELLRVLKNREELEKVPVIMITGTAQSTAEKVKGFQGGANDYVLKPFETVELLERVKLHLKISESRPTPASAPVPAPAPMAVPYHSPVPQASVSPAATDGPTPAGDLVPSTRWSALRDALLAPGSLNLPNELPHAASVVFMSLMLLTAAGVALTFGPGPRLAVALGGVAALWLAALMVLVISSSLLGIHLGWVQGARLQALAALPLVLKLSGGVLTTAWTSLSPLLATASPALVFAGAPWIVRRLDAFELWSLALLWTFLARWEGSTRLKRLVITALVWVTLAVAAFLGSRGAS